MKRVRVALLMAGSLIATSSSFAAIIGTNTPSHALTAERIAALPRAQRGEWQQYLARSQRQLQVDQSFFKSEMRRAGIKEAVVPPSARGARSLPLDRDAD